MNIVELIYRYDANDASARPRPSDAREALMRLNAGNQAFAALLDGQADDNGTTRRVIPVDPRDLGLLQGRESAPDQKPFAAVLGCSDARVPVELIFTEGPNDLFVVRVAGNGLGSEVLGSLNYAIDHLGGSLKLLVVLGHSGCGAVSAAVDVFLEPRTYLSLASQHALRSILDRLMGVVHAASRKMLMTYGPDLPQRPGYRAALVETAVVLNAALSAQMLQHEIGGDHAQGLRASYGVYLIATRQIWAPRAGSAHDCVGLAPTPPDEASFGVLVDAVIRSPRIAGLLALGQPTA